MKYISGADLKDILGYDEMGREIEAIDCEELAGIRQNCQAVEVPCVGLKRTSSGLLFMEINLGHKADYYLLDPDDIENAINSPQEFIETFMISTVTQMGNDDGLELVRWGLQDIEELEVGENFKTEVKVAIETPALGYVPLHILSNEYGNAVVFDNYEAARDTICALEENSSCSIDHEEGVRPNYYIIAATAHFENTVLNLPVSSQRDQKLN